MATINNKTVPFSGLEAGDTWTGSYTHSVRGKATECLGFCYLIYNKIWGSDTYGSTIPKKTLKGTSSDFSGILPGAWVRCGDYWHALIILDKDSNGVTVYDCNFSGTDEIDTRYYTWSSFKSTFTNFQYGYNPA